MGRLLLVSSDRKGRAVGVIAEWWWSCDVAGCEERGEEPRYDEEASRAELAEHMAEEHGQEGQVER